MQRQFILAITVGLFWFSQFSYVPILPTYARDLGASYQLIGLILGSYGFTQMLVRLPLGILSDRRNQRKPLIVAGMAICFASGLGMWLFPNIYAVLAFRALAGVAASFWVLHTVLFASYYPSAEATKASGRITAVLNLGEMLAMLSGGAVAFFYSQEATFLLAAASGLLAILFSLAVEENSQLQRKPITMSDLMETARGKHLNIVSLLGLLLQVMTFGTIFGFIPLVAKNLGASFWEIGLLPTVFMIPGIIASSLSGTVLLRIMDERRLLVTGFLIMAGVCLVTPFITSLPMLYLSQAICGLARGAAYPLLMGLGIQQVAESRRGTAMGYYQAMIGLGMFLGPMTVGKLGQIGGLDWGFWAVGLVAAAGAAIAFGLLPERRCHPACS